MNGELRRKNPWLEGQPQTIPAGCVIEFNAKGTRAQNADRHDTIFGARVSLVAVTRRELEITDCCLKTQSCYEV